MHSQPIDDQEARVCLRQLVLLARERLNESKYVGVKLIPEVLLRKGESGAQWLALHNCKRAWGHQEAALHQGSRKQDFTAHTLETR